MLNLLTTGEKVFSFHQSPNKKKQKNQYIIAQHRKKHYFCKRFFKPLFSLSGKGKNSLF